MTKQIIDSATGQLMLSNDFCICKKTVSKEIINYFGQDNIEAKGIEANLIRYWVRDFKVYDTYFYFIFYFEYEILKMVDFAVCDKSLNRPSWDNWREKNELENLNIYKRWLTEQIGAERKFDWGSIDATYDSKGGSASIILNYE